MNSLDLKDKKLLYEIDLNARLGTSALGKRIGLSQEGVHYRLKRLEQRRIVTGYMTLLNFAKVGYTGYAVYARFHAVTTGDKHRIIAELRSHDHIYWIAEFGGKYDLAFGVMARNIVHFNEIYTGLSTKYNDVMKDFTVAIRVELQQFPRTYLLGEKRMQEHAPMFGRYIESEEIDQTDAAILQILAGDARISLLELAKRISCPASTVHARVRQLEKRGIIQGYSTHIHCQEFGYQSFQLFLTAHNLTKERKRALRSYCQTNPNILFYIETVGKWNFEVIYEVENQRMFQELLIEFRTRFADVILDVESIVIFDHYVKYNQYPLR